MAVGGLLLGGAPIGLPHTATDLIDSQQTPLTRAAIIFASALTGAAVLRACARIFFGYSGAPGPEVTAPTQREHEKAKRPLWLMLLPCAILLVFGCTSSRALDPILAASAAQLSGAGNAISLPQSDMSLAAFVPLAIMSVILAVSLARTRPTGCMARRLTCAETLPVKGLQLLHSGYIGDYAVWIVCGLATLAAVIGL